MKVTIFVIKPCRAHHRNSKLCISKNDHTTAVAEPAMFVYCSVRMLAHSVSGEAFPVK